jgi:alpha-L-rhamnosidase
MTRTPFDLTTDHGGDQFAATGDRPRLSWKLPSDAPADSVHELEALVDGKSLPGPQRVIGHRFITWPWMPLLSGQRVTWRVRTTSTPEASGWSDWAAFEVGLLDGDWTASWISPVESADPGYGKRPAALLSTEFAIAVPVRSARLYTTALGLYTAAVNGERAGTAELAPGSTSYDRTLYAQASDVTDSLRLGANRLEIVLSDGWYRGQVGAFRMPAGWGTVLGLRVELHIEHVDGTRTVVRSDDRWTSRRSSIVRADLMDGQTVDLTAGKDTPAPVRVGAVDAPMIDVGEPDGESIGVVRIGAGVADVESARGVGAQEEDAQGRQHGATGAADEGESRETDRGQDYPAVEGQHEPVPNNLDPLAGLNPQHSQREIDDFQNRGRGNRPCSNSDQHVLARRAAAHAGQQAPHDEHHATHVDRGICPQQRLVGVQLDEVVRGGSPIGDEDEWDSERDQHRW